MTVLRGVRRPTAATRFLLALVALCSIAGAWQAAQPNRLAHASQTIAFGSRTVELTVNGEDEQWAQRVTDLVVAGGPVLEELIGVPYPGAEAMTINERSSEQLGGYAGLAGCSLFSCHIQLSSYFDDTTLLHELTHAWTQSYRNRWLAEGMAEYISDRASARIDGRPLPVLEAAGDKPPFPLLDWTLTIDFVTAEEEDIQAEYEGYYWSQRFFEQLEATVGADAVKRTMAAVVPLQGGTVGVRRFMDALDDAGGANADDLFLSYVFPPDREPEISERRAARDRLSAVTARGAAEASELPQDVLTPIRQRIDAWEFAQAVAALDRVEPGLAAYLQLRDRLSALKSAAEAAGLEYPYPMQYALQTWDFAPFLDTIDDAEAALPAYLAAKEKLSGPRSLWQRVGLFGRSPDADLDRAAGAFESADFSGTIEDSRAAEANLQKSGSQALTNLLVGAGLLVLILVAGALLLRWAARNEPTPAQA